MLFRSVKNVRRSLLYAFLGSPTKSYRSSVASEGRGDLFFIADTGEINGAEGNCKLTLFDFILSIIIGIVAAGALGSSTTALNGVIITVSALAGFQIILSIFSLKFSRLRRVGRKSPSCWYKTASSLNRP